MIATSTVEAVIVGDPDVPLAIVDASVTLDESRAPHVQADLTISLPDEATLALLDARELVRIRIDALMTYPGSFIADRERSFDLGLRRIVRNLADGTVTLTLASDEALLMDEVLVATGPDTSALDDQASVRAIVDGILDRIGAELEPGTADAAFRVLTTAENLVQNPRLGSASTFWSHSGASATATRQTSGGPAGCPTFWRSTMTGSNPAPFIIQYDRTGLEVAATRDYIVSFYVRCSVAVTLSADWLVFNSGGSQIQDGPDMAPFSISPNAWVRVAFNVATPAAAASARVRVFTTTTLGTGATLDVTGLVVTVDDHVLGSDLNTYYDGDTTDSSEYAYAWTGTPHASTSTRTALIDRAPELLHWQPGDDAWSFLQNVWQAAGFRLFCDEERRWFLVDGATYIAPGTLQLTMPGNLHSASDTIDRESGDWFDAAIVRYRWRRDDGTTAEAIDTYIGGGTRATLIEREAPYPGPGLAEYVVKRAEGKGRTADLDALADLTVTPSQVLNVTLPDTLALLGVVRSIAYDLTQGTMRVASRGLTDIPDGAYLLADPDMTYDLAPAVAYDAWINPDGD